MALFGKLMVIGSRNGVPLMVSSMNVATAVADSLLKPDFLTDLAWLVLLRSLKLSHRECQILAQLLRNESEAAIASHLGISHHTVRTYTQRLYRKIGVHNRCEAVVRVFAEYVSLQVKGCITLVRDDPS